MSETREALKRVKSWYTLTAGEYWKKYDCKPADPYLHMKEAVEAALASDEPSDAVFPTAEDEAWIARRQADAKRVHGKSIHCCIPPSMRRTLTDSQYLTDKHVIERFLVAVGKANTQKEYAESVGVSQQHITDMIHGRRRITGLVLESLGLKEVFAYVPANDTGSDVTS